MDHVSNNNTNQNDGGDTAKSMRENLLSQVQMFMSDEQKARLYGSPTNSQNAQSVRPAANNVRPEVNSPNPQKDTPLINLNARPANGIGAVAAPSNQILQPRTIQSEAPQKPANVDKASPLMLQPSNFGPGERRAATQAKSRSIGRVICCDGTKVIIHSNVDGQSASDDDAWSIGQMISVSTKYGRIVAMITEMKTEKGQWRDEDTNGLIVSADIMGEVYDGRGGLSFKRGVTRYPPVGSVAHKIRYADLECIYDMGQRKTIEVGRLSQNSEIAAAVGVDDILGRHVAILGTTGVGKSCAVSLVVSRAIEAESALRVIMLDPHNEFADAFGDKAINLDQNNLDLPFWLLTFEELQDVVFRNQINEEESDILRDLVVLAKHERQFQLAQQNLSEPSTGLIMIDTPVSYRISEVIKNIDECLGQLEPKYSRAALKSLRTRLEALENNPRYNFMFARGGREDSFSNIISKIFRLPANGKPMATINLSGLPSEVINCVASVIARLCFDVARASNGAMRVLLVCEEAHRYVPKERELGFFPTRLAISRIAKEGRKYNCSVAIITQRPGELDPTILSQCSTVFAMRLTNESDQEIIKAALSDSSGSIVSFMSSLDNREAIAFGEGVAVPMRLHFADYDLAKMRAERGNTDAISRPDINQLEPSALVMSMRGIQEQVKINPIAESIARAGNAIENPLRNGLVRPSLLKKDISEILAKHSKGNDTNSNQPHPSLRKDKW